VVVVCEENDYVI